MAAFAVKQSCNLLDKPPTNYRYRREANRRDASYCSLMIGVPDGLCEPPVAIGITLDLIRKLH
jgi:hypothetical protein